VYQGFNNRIIGGDFNGNTTDVDLAHQTTKYSAILEDCMIDEAARRAIRVYENSGNFLPLDSDDGDWQAPDSGMDWILQATPSSYNDGASYAGQMELSPANFDPMAQFVEAGSRTITMKIYPVGWTAALTNAEIYLEASYLDTADTGHRAIAVTGAGTFNNGAWRELTVSFTPAQAGIVYFNLILKTYELNCYVLIDPVPSFS